MEATFRKVMTTRKTPNTINVNEPPSRSIKSLTNQKKLFFQISGKVFIESQLPQSIAIGIYV